MKRTWAIAMMWVAGVAFAGSARAEGQWAKEHPRRHEVNQRLERQNDRVNAGEQNKSMTYQQGSKVKAEDRNIRRQERGMARMNGGHITKGEQRTLNREENKVNREIRRDKRRNAR